MTRKVASALVALLSMSISLASLPAHAQAQPNYESGHIPASPMYRRVF